MRRPASATAEGDGIIVGHGPVTVDAFIAFLCPYCRRFEFSSGAALSSVVVGGLISLVYHPMSFLDQASTTRYSSRAAAASGCASDGAKFVGYAGALFNSQPPEGGPARFSLHAVRAQRALPGLAALRDRDSHGTWRQCHADGPRQRCPGPC